MDPSARPRRVARGTRVPVSVDRESVLVGGSEARDEKVRAAYAAVAASYAEELDDELAGLPFECWLLRRVVGLSDGAPVIEVGSGPGHVAAFLAEAGAQATGLDLTPEMVDEARRRHPEVSYQVGDLRRLMRPATHDGWGAVLAWYSLIHLAASEMPDAIASLTRPLRSDGWLVLALHAGADVRTLTEWFGHEIDLDVVLHDPAEIVATVQRAGLRDVEWFHRGPFTSRGETTERLYLLPASRDQRPSWASGQVTSNRSRFMTLSHARHEVAHEFLLAVLARVNLGDGPQLRVRPEDQVDGGGGPRHVTRRPIATLVHVLGRHRGLPLRAPCRAGSRRSRSSTPRAGR